MAPSLLHFRLGIEVQYDELGSREGASLPRAPLLPPISQLMAYCAHSDGLLLRWKAASRPPR